ncbi:hypothetical protein H4R33_005006 [Dimargaris cristalligena]|nr:hypothetical protein H4R33_005006 [Dimargaris cristalligena]
MSLDEAGRPRSLGARYFYHHGRFFATYQASMLVLTVSCIAVLILPPLARLVSTAWQRREIPYTFTPISSYMRDTNFFAKVGQDPMLVWQTIKMRPQFDTMTITPAFGSPSSALLSGATNHWWGTSPDPPAYVLTKPALRYALQFQQELLTTSVSLEEVRQFLSHHPSSTRTPLDPWSDSSEPPATTRYQLSDICFRLDGQRDCLLISPLVYWKHQAQLLEADPDVEATVVRQADSPIHVMDIAVSPEMLWENLRLFNTTILSPAPGADGHGPALSDPVDLTRATADGFHLSVIAVESWQGPVTTQSVLQALIHKTVLQFNAQPSCVDGASPCLPHPRLAIKPEIGDRTFRAHFQTDYSKFALEHYFLAIGCLSLFAYIYYTFYRLDLVKSKFWLGFATTLMLICSMFLALSICTTVSRPHPFLPWEILPFFVIILGVENVHAITQSVVQVPFDLPVRERIGQGLARVGPTMLFRLLVELIALTIGVVLSVDIVKEFCVFLMLSIIVDHVFQLTFFITVLSIDIRRLEISDLYRKRTNRPDHGGQPDSATDPNFGHHPAYTRDAESSSASTTIIKAPAVLFRHLHRFWMRQRAYSIFLLVGFVGLLYYLYDHTANAVNIIFPAQENVFISNILLQDSAETLSQVMKGFHSIEKSRGLMAYYHLGATQMSEFIQQIEPQLTSPVIWGFQSWWARVQLGWSSFGQALSPYSSSLATGAVWFILFGNPRRVPLPAPIRRIMTPQALSHMNPWAVTSWDARIGPQDVVDIDTQLPTNISDLRPVGSDHVWATSQTGEATLLNLGQLKAHLNRLPILSRWRSPTDSENWARPPSIWNCPSDIRTVVVGPSGPGRPLFARDCFNSWAAMADGRGGPVSVWQTIKSADGVVGLNPSIFDPTASPTLSSSRLTALALLYNTPFDGQWVIGTEPFGATKWTQLAQPYLAVAYEGATIALFPVSGLGETGPIQCQPWVTWTLEISEPIVEIHAVNNHIVCRGLSGTLHVYFIPQRVAGDSWSIANVQVSNEVSPEPPEDNSSPKPPMPPTSDSPILVYSIPAEESPVVTITSSASCPYYLFTGSRSGAVLIRDIQSGQTLVTLSEGSSPYSTQMSDVLPPTSFSWPPLSVDVPSSTTEPHRGTFNVPLPATALDTHHQPLTTLGSNRHTDCIRTIMVYPERNALKKITRLFVVTTSDDEAVQVWQLTLSDYSFEPLVSQPSWLVAGVESSYPCPTLSPPPSPTFLAWSSRHHHSRSAELSPHLVRSPVLSPHTSAPPSPTHPGLLPLFPIAPMVEGINGIGPMVTSPPRNSRRKSYHRDRTDQHQHSHHLSLANLPEEPCGATVDRAQSHTPVPSVMHLLTVSQPGCTTACLFQSFLMGVRRPSLGEDSSEMVEVPGSQPDDNSFANSARPPVPDSGSDGWEGPAAWSFWILNLADLRTSDDDPRKRQLDQSFAIKSIPLSPKSHVTSGLGDLLSVTTPWFGYPSSRSVGYSSSSSSAQRFVADGGRHFHSPLGHHGATSAQHREIHQHPSGSTHSRVSVGLASTHTRKRRPTLGSTSQATGDNAGLHLLTSTGTSAQETPGYDWPSPPRCSDDAKGSKGSNAVSQRRSLRRGTHGISGTGTWVEMQPLPISPRRSKSLEMEPAGLAELDHIAMACPRQDLGRRLSSPKLTSFNTEVTPGRGTSNGKGSSSESTRYSPPYQAVSETASELSQPSSAHVYLDPLLPFSTVRHLSLIPLEPQNTASTATGSNGQNRSVTVLIAFGNTIKSVPLII